MYSMVRHSANTEYKEGNVQREIQGIEYDYRFKKGMRRGWKGEEGVESGWKGVKGVERV